MARPSGLFSSLFNRISNRDRAFLARQIAVMLEAGIPLTQALRSLIEQTKNPALNQVLELVLADVENGKSFSKAIEKHPDVFNGVFVSVVAAGEVSGKLDVVTNLLADELERDQDFRSRVVGALIYPAFILLAMVAVGIIMVTRIVPALELVFKEANVDLPWTTQTVIFITNSLINYWYLYIIGLVVIIYLIRRYLTLAEGRKNANALALKLPVIGHLIENVEMARFTRIFGMMLVAGVPIIQAIDAVALVLENVVYRNALSSMARNVERGSPISQSLQRDKIFPATITQMIAVGEQTGKLEKVLLDLAHYYEGETDQSVKNITALTEPVVFVIVGIGVAFLVFSIIVPIYNLASVIR